MAFKPGQSGNPAGRPKKLLRRIDEVLFEKGLEPIAEVLKILDALKRQRPVVGAPPERLKEPAEIRAWQAAERADQLAALRKQRLEIWLELLPYVYARPKELPEDAGDDLAKLPTRDLIRIVKEKVPELREEKA